MIIISGVRGTQISAAKVVAKNAILVLWIMLHQKSYIITQIFVLLIVLNNL